MVERFNPSTTSSSEPTSPAAGSVKDWLASTACAYASVVPLRAPRTSNCGLAVMLVWPDGTDSESFRLNVTVRFVVVRFLRRML